MSSDFDIDALRARLSAIMASRGIKPTALSLAVGKSPTLVKDLMGKTSDVRVGTLARIAEVLEVDLTALLEGEVAPIQTGPTLFVKGEVAAGVWRDAWEWPQSDWKTFTGRPDVNAKTDYRFGLIVRGDSMNEVYPESTIIECVSVFGGAEIAPGKRVVVIRSRGNDEYEATVKELVEQDGELWAVPKSSNPSHQPIRLNGGDGTGETRIAAIVVASVRPE